MSHSILNFVLILRLLVSVFTDKAARSLYGLKTIRAHGLTGQSLWDVTCVTLIAQVLYAAYLGGDSYTTAENDRVQLATRKAQGYGFHLAVSKTYIAWLIP